MQLGAWRNPSSLLSSKLLAKGSDGHVYTYDRSLESMTSIASGFSSDRKGRFANAEQYALFADGSRIPIAYDGTTVHRLGIDKPGTPTGAVGSGGSWTGTYSFAVTAVDSTRGVESVPSDTISLTPSSQLPQISRGTVDSTATHWNVYAADTANDPSGILYLINSTPIPVGTSSYTVPSSYVPIPAPLSFLSNLPAPNLERITFFNGTYFGAIGNKLYWSKPLFPWAWPGDNVTTVPFEGNDTVMGFAALQDSLIIFGRRNIVLLTGYAPMFTLVRLDANVGVAGTDAFVELPGSVAFLSDDGIRLYPGLEVISKGINRELLNTLTTIKEQAVMAYSHEENAIWLTMGGKTYVLFLANRAVSTYSFNPVAVLSGGVTGFDRNILLMRDGSAYTYSGADDDEVPIRCAWYSKVFQMDNPETTKYFRRIGLLASHGSESIVTVAIMDSTGGISQISPVSLDAIVTRWDDFTWDNAQWTHEGVEYFVAALPAHRLVGSTVQVRISGEMEAGTEIVPPLTLLFRESLRFLGR